MNYVGSRYEESKDLDIAQIAKLVRKDLRDAQKRGKLPANLKSSVRIDRYSMGESLEVTLELPDVLCAAAYYWNGSFLDYDSESRFPRYTAVAMAIWAEVAEIVNAYNYNASETVSDYHDYRFADGVKWNDRAEYAALAIVREQEYRVALEAKREAKRAETRGLVAATGWDE